jgi:thiamine biosynthesis lipoprotein
MTVFALAGGGCGRVENSAGSTAVERVHFQLSGRTMGVEWHATVVDAAAGVTDAEIRTSIQETLERVDGLMSTYKPESEISRFGRAAAGESFTVSAETAKVVAEAQRIAALSGGAFDATVMPLVDLWGFGPAENGADGPSTAQLEAALAICGWHKLQVVDGFTLRKHVDGLRLDLSAIAKGYGVDAVCAALDELGHGEYLVEVGGELRTAGKSPDGSPWNIGIDAPIDMSMMGQELQATIEVGDVALATSGDYRNFRLIDGQRISHTIDPRSGRPVRHELASVTILAPTCMLADALATTSMVLGPEDALQLVEEAEGVECLLVIREGDKLVTRQSSGFPEL